MDASDWVARRTDVLREELAELLSIPSVSTDGQHQPEIERAAEAVCGQMRRAGLQDVEILRDGHGASPYCYGQWLLAPGKPTVLFYSHLDVQPAADVEKWGSDPWTLASRGGRLYGRGAADDKGAIVAQLAAVRSLLDGQGRLPANVKMIVEAQEEVGSPDLIPFMERHAQRLACDVLVVCDTENIVSGTPCVTSSLRGIVSMKVTVRSATGPRHSGMVGGLLADPAIALNALLARLMWGNGPLPIPGIYEGARELSKSEREAIASLPYDEAKARQDLGLLEGVRLANEAGRHPYEQTWYRPAVTVIAQEASSFRNASNQVLPEASALVSCRIVPNQDPEVIFNHLKAFLTKDPPWGVRVDVEPRGNVAPWRTDPRGAAFDAAMRALQAGFGAAPRSIGCGGTIGFVGPACDLLGGVPALLLGIEDPQGNAHAPDESLHEGDFHKLIASLAALLENLAAVPALDVEREELNRG